MTPSRSISAPGQLQGRTSSEEPWYSDDEYSDEEYSDEEETRVDPDEFEQKNFLGEPIPTLFSMESPPTSPR